MAHRNSNITTLGCGFNFQDTQICSSNSNSLVIFLSVPLYFSAYAAFIASTTVHKHVSRLTLSAVWPRLGIAAVEVWPDRTTKVNGRPNILNKTLHKK
jgi:hypothetical protein